MRNNLRTRLMQVITVQWVLIIINCNLANIVWTWLKVELEANYITIQTSLRANVKQLTFQECQE